MGLLLKQSPILTARHMWLINTPKKSAKRKVKSSKQKKLEWEGAEDVKEDIEHILNIIQLPHVDTKRIFYYRTQGSKSRSYARIWTFPKIFQVALGIPASYVIEVLSKYYDKLDGDEKKKVLIHELLHIPKNFSGALLPHAGRGRHLGSEVNRLFKEYQYNVKTQRSKVKTVTQNSKF